MKERRTIRKSVLSLLLVLTLAFSTQLCTFANSWRTGNVPNNNVNTGAITVTLSNKNKDAYIKVHAYADKNRFSWLTDKAVKERNCTFTVTMRDKNGKWVWEGKINTGSGGKKMKLGKDHSVYKLYLRHTQYHAGEHFDLGHYCPRYWGIECVSNCTVK